MKIITIGMSLIMFATAGIANAQDIPVPAEETQVPGEGSPVPAEETQVPGGETLPVEPAVPVQSANDGQQEKQPSDGNQNAAQLIAFFDGLEKAAQGDNCEAISNAIRAYCQSHQEWIDSLDYASGNVDAATIQTIHEKAMSFGKTLSACYDEKSIPALLRRYAGLGNEL